MAKKYITGIPVCPKCKKPVQVQRRIGAGIQIEYWHCQQHGIVKEITLRQTKMEEFV